jgi:benzoylformate decarboxylase
MVGRMNVREATVDLLRRLRMTTIFGNPGSTELPLVREFPEDFRYVLGLQEAVVVGMADGFAQATRNAAFINLHSAVGVGNAMGAIFTAYKNRTPLVITAGQQARSIMPYEPFLGSRDATELPKPYVKWSVEPARAEDVPLAIQRAYTIAMTQPRGPALVSVPVDDWDRPAEPVSARIVSQRFRSDPDLMSQIGAALDAAERPAFVVGSAIDRDEAFEEVVSLAERHRARVFAAPLAGRCGFPETHPLFCGFLPPMREQIVAALAGADLVFAIGAPAFTYHIEGAGPHIPDGAKLAQLIDDPMTASWTPQGIAAIGSLKLGLADLLARTAPRARPFPKGRGPTPRVEPTVPLSTAFVMQTLADMRPADSIIFEEAPSARPPLQRHLPISIPEGYFTMDSGGLGFGLPAAVGVALGKPGRRIVAVIGDGSSLYSIQGLWNAARLATPICFVILNNGGYARLKQFAPVFGFGKQEPVQGTDIHGLDYVALARGFGCPATQATDAEGLQQALRDALGSTGPSLVEVVVT